MRPGNTLFIDTHPFQIETVQDDGYTLFLRLEPGEPYEAARAWVEEKRRTGRDFVINGTYTAATAYVSAIRESEQKEGVLRIKVELMDESAYTLWWSVAR